ncbi:1167_t:CDS:2 [Funneliformis mosseae]|uniref:1167_t:CDS:1 n=1 Tax=Funneliformis mosseae TaxID=27381 RepID=A0A9N9CYQ3_FUNMO|nr:1167_t:CDS:2 [Funneliformis mosseae]
MLKNKSNTSIILSAQYPSHYKVKCLIEGINNGEDVNEVYDLDNSLVSLLDN